MTTEFTQKDQQLLLKLARSSIQSHLKGEKLSDIDLINCSQPLQQIGACFVTLTKQGQLRGCVGSVEATQPLILDVRDRALGAAFQDYRFPNLIETELSEVRIAISCLTPPCQLPYSSPEELSHLLHPGVDGVILKYQDRRGTFLPQVWKQLPDPEIFLSRLCLKMGLDSDAWKIKKMEVKIYQTITFEEELPGDS
jgi:AmmeMemoRadiSam system protein A